MSYLKEFSNYLGSDLFVLTYESNPIAFRVKVYNLDSRQYDFADFSKKLVSDKAQQEYINKNYEKIKKVPLLSFDTSNGTQIIRVFKTEDEQRENLTVGELTSEADVKKKLGTLMKIMKAREVSKNV